MSWRNCPRCGKAFTFTRGGPAVCPMCVKEESDNYFKVFHFFSSRPTATAQEISNETGVDLKSIYRYVRENRLRLVKIDMGLICQSCGTQILKGKMCENCLKKLSDDLTSDIKRIKQNKKNEANNHDEGTDPRHLKRFRDKWPK